MKGFSRSFAVFGPIARWSFASAMLAMLLVVMGCVPTDQPEASIIRPATQAAATPIIEAPEGRALIVWQRETGHDRFLNSLRIGWKSPLLTEYVLAAYEHDRAFRPMLGVTFDTRSSGVRILSVAKDSVAEAAGILAGDWVTHAAQRPLSRREDLVAIVRVQRPGQELPLMIQRNGVQYEKLARFPLAEFWHEIRDYRIAAFYPDAVPFDPRVEPAFMTSLLPGSYVFHHQYETRPNLIRIGMTNGNERLSRTLAGGEVLFGYLARSGAITLSATPPAGWSAARLAQLRTFDNHERIQDFFRDHRMWRADRIALDVGPDGCPQGDFETNWSNARFSGVFEGCVRFAGRLDYDTGARLDVRDATLGQPGAENTQFKSVMYTDTDGRRYRGAWSLANADGNLGQRVLPLPSLTGIGQELRADGSGIVGRFVDGQIQGPAWCFDVLSGEVCHFENGQRQAETGAQRRSVPEILSLEPGLSPSMTIDLLRQRQIQALLGERWAEFLQLEADLSALGVDTGIEALFYVGRALGTLGRNEAALLRIQAYLNIAGASGASYGEALSLFADLRPRAEAERQSRLSRENEDRMEREQFCRAAQVSGDALCGCREFPMLAIQPGNCS